MGRKKKTDMDNQTTNQSMPEVTTRDPAPENRDPVRRTCTPRLYIQANSPTVCPKCSGCTRMDNGRHVDPVRRKILEYRTCARCDAKLAAGRDMTEYEIEKLCVRAEAVEEYERLNK